MLFIGRDKEMGRLNALAARREGGLAVVWGRRRVGKTRLLLEWIGAKDGLYTVADQSSPGLQLSFFARALEARFPGFAEVEYPDWNTLLNRLAGEAGRRKWRGPVVVDELPYLVEASPELPSVLQRWVDHEARAAGLVVALAGSSQRMMQGLVLDEGAPLYGRARENLRLEPLGVEQVRRAFPRLTAAEAIRHYAVWGGIPWYWELAGGEEETPDESLDRLVLDPMGVLHREPERLLLEEQPPALTLRPLLDSIGGGAHKLSEIAGRIGQPATAFGRPLARLVDMGFIRRELPFGESARSSKRSLYRIADPFLRLWFRLVAPNRALLAGVPRASRLALWGRHRDHLCAETWEELCRQAVPRLDEKCGVPGGPWGPASRYWGGNGPEWDVVARSLDGKRWLLGEAKWSFGTNGEASFQEAARALCAKGLPPLAGITEGRVSRVAFVPEGGKQKSNASPEVVGVGAEEVLESFSNQGATP